MYQGRPQDSGWAGGRGRGRGAGGDGDRGRGRGYRGGGSGGFPSSSLNRDQRTSVVVNTNCFEITKLPSNSFYLYDISWVALTFHFLFIDDYAENSIVIQPERKNVEDRQLIMKKLQTSVAPTIFSPRALYDGNALLYSSHMLRLAGGGSAKFDIDLTGLRTEAKPGARGVYTVQLTLTSSNPIRPSDLEDVIQGEHASPKSITAINLLQLLIRQAPNQLYPHNTKAYFTDAQKADLGIGLELWRGFFQSVRPSIGKMLVNIDTTMIVVYQNGPLINLALRFLGYRDVRQLNLQRNTVDFRRLEKFLNNLKIIVNTPGSRDRPKAIRGLVPDAGNFVFSKDGQDMSVAEYIQAVSNVEIRHRSIIGIRLTPPNATNHAIIPLEICEVKPGQFYRQRLPDRYTKTVVTFSTLKPEKRLDAILGRGAERMLPSPIKGYLESEFMKDAKMEVGTQPIQIRGELLALPKVVFGNQSSVELRNGSWNVAKQRFARPASLPCWGIITFSRTMNGIGVTNIISDMVRCCKDLGMEVIPPVFTKNGPDHAPERVLEDAEFALKAAWKKIDPALMENIRAAKLPSPRPLIIVILPKMAQELWRKVKHWSDVGTGILTQCLQDDKIKTANPQYWGNVALKLNARLGGYNSLVDSPAMITLRKEMTIVMGADVSHPGPGVQKPSVASLVASHDAYASRYMAFTRIQHPRQEFIQDLQDMVTDAIQSFTKVNSLPQRIVLLRDGVSEGEFESVSGHEISAIREGVNAVMRQRGINHVMPKLTYIIVGKRHHVTFFPEAGTEANDGRGNCVAGFVNDTDDFSNPATVDFYLQSHGAIQGTSRSAHYTVMLDEVYNGNLQQIQDLAFTLCHVYAKATRSVSIPAPVYYADLVCARGPIHFSDESELRLGESDMASNVSGQQVFDLALWQKSFKQTNQHAAREMYFL
ncbi:Piwi domain-containing protein [Lentinula aciculospora]|uniref:Piwi domain-containing protein n=1 Tax=Lentinula aciculospora TaxID=153920 RepID=A0A9W9DWC0_9AGAR|nr:Piwi domain-containing protein [Lentinula aciculospora]